MALLNFERIHKDDIYRNLSQGEHDILMAILLTCPEGVGKPKRKTLQDLSRVYSTTYFDKHIKSLSDKGILTKKTESVSVYRNNKKVPRKFTMYIVSSEWIKLPSIDNTYLATKKVESIKHDKVNIVEKTVDSTEVEAIVDNTEVGTQKVRQRELKGDNTGKRVTRGNPTAHEHPADVVSPRPDNISSNGEQDPTAEEYERLRQEWYKKEFAPTVDNASLNESVAVLTDDIPF